MRLPGREDAWVPEEKLRDYLLSMTHPVGRTKARWLRAIGFDAKSAAWLGRALLVIATDEDVSEVRSSVHGTVYVIDGDLRGPSGLVSRARTIWIVEPHDERPGFVTAYPAEEGQGSDR